MLARHTVHRAVVLASKALMIPVARERLARIRHAARGWQGGICLFGRNLTNLRKVGKEVGNLRGLHGLPDGFNSTGHPQHF